MRSDVSRTVKFVDLAPCPSSLFELRRGSLRYDRARRTVAGVASEGWWSQTGSNRRPHACKARALPAELWPRNQKTNAHVGRARCTSMKEKRTRSKVVGLGRLELPTSRLSSARSNQLSYKPLTPEARSRAIGSSADASHKR
jgi:hypothetical protein